MSDYIGQNYDNNHKILSYLRSIVPSAKYIFNTTMQDSTDPNYEGRDAIIQKNNSRTADENFSQAQSMISKLSPLQRMQLIKMTQTSPNSGQGMASASAQSPQNF